MMTGYGYSAALLAQLTGVTLRTAQRWKRAGAIPQRYRDSLSLTLEGDLGHLCPQWRGFRLLKGTLMTPEGEALTPGDLRAVPIRKAQVRELERRLSEPQQWRLL
ncbi:MAG: DUF3653 domain-containing protein [Steroidobacteraceae bacterium]